MGDAATLTRPVHFRSKHHNLRVLRIKATHIPDPLGGDAKEIPGLRYEFQDFKLIVDEDLIERDRLFFEERARLTGKPFDGDPKTLEFLREHGENGSSFIEIPLSAMAPPSAEANREVTKLMARLDREGLEAMLAEERETYQREDLIENLETAIAACLELEQPPEPPAAA